MIDWNEERQAKLKQMWTAGFSCSQIAKSIGGGCTRNAVIGKVHRMGLQERPRQIPATIITARVRQRLKAAPRIARSQPKLALVSSTAPGALNVGLLDLGAHDCRWPTGEDGQHLFCGHPQMTGSSYCPLHSAQSWTARQPKPIRIVSRMGERRRKHMEWFGEMAA